MMVKILLFEAVMETRLQGNILGYLFDAFVEARLQRKTRGCTFVIVVDTPWTNDSIFARPSADMFSRVDFSFSLFTSSLRSFGKVSQAHATLAG